MFRKLDVEIRAPPNTSWISRLNAVGNGFTLRASMMSILPGEVQRRLLASSD